MTARILVVDDDPVQRRLLEASVRRLGHDVLVAEGGEEAAKLLADPAERIDCVVLDLMMPKLDGLGLLARLRELEIEVPVIVQTANGGIDTAVSAIRAGASDFVVKPVGAERLQVSLANAMAQQALKGEIRRMKRSASGTLSFRDVLSRSPRMRAALKLAEKAAASNIPVLLEGESGVGKELIARAIQGSGERREKPFVAVNCGAIPANLVESILFGHERGAFTGADTRQTGKFLEANGGTLFLDEVGELPVETQVKLLRVLQEGEIDPLGARRPVKVDVRIISATNRDLAALTREGRFREDLFYRLHVFPITIPPLRERPEDIPDLVRHFIARFGVEEGKTIRSVSAAAMQMLAEYRWPGNVRQLENSVFRAVVLADADTIDVDEFPQIAAQAPGRAVPEAPAPVPAAAAALVIGEGAAPGAGARAPIVPSASPEGFAPAPVAGGLALLDGAGQVRPMEELEAEIIRFAIDHYQGRMTEIARRLKIGRSTLYRKLTELGLGEGAEAAGEAGDGPA
ncbi:sigma-54-dependent transcriptional regulator [Ancylobacter terrae]|uniref:sigma-54-dependent transcriptional regulator n=1 Tax=Ancylobacter sp. sgz301288 TaxID=3342077 RepID=UPI00385A0CD2